MNAVNASILSAMILFVGPAAAQSVKLPVEVKGEPGSFVRIAAETDCAALQWLAIDPGLNLFPVELLKDTKTAVVTASAAGRYRLLAYGAKANKASEPSICMVIIGQPAPVVPPVTPPVVPPVIPPVTPPVPDVLGFSTLARTEGQKLSAEAKALTAGLAANFDSTGSRLAAGSLTTIEAANAELSAKNKATVGGLRESWLPWFIAWQAHADKLNATVLRTVEDYVKAYQETAAGLRQVK